MVEIPQQEGPDLGLHETGHNVPQIWEATAGLNYRSAQAVELQQRNQTATLNWSVEELSMSHLDGLQY